MAVSKPILCRNITNLRPTLGPFEGRDPLFNLDNISTGICAADRFWCSDHLRHDPHWGLSPGMFCEVLQLLLVLGFGIWICKYDVHFSLARLFLCGLSFAHAMPEEEFRRWDHVLDVSKWRPVGIVWIQKGVRREHHGLWYSSKVSTGWLKQWTSTYPRIWWTQSVWDP